MKRLITFRSEDGFVFDTESECLAYESQVKDEGIYLFGEKITEKRLLQQLSKGYHLTNYSPGKLAIFAPNGGGYGYIYGDLADRLGKIHDPHNYAVHERRRKAG